MQHSIASIFMLTVISNSQLPIEAFVYFPGGAAGMLFAIAVPLDLPKLYNVFMSYNFESNYRVPSMVTDFTKGPTLLHRVRRDGSKCVEMREGDHLLHEDVWSEEANGKPKIKEECEPVNAPQFEPMITRKRIYQWIEDKLELHGYPGQECLLKVICEHTSSSFSKYNGILGDVFHILLSPYSSQLEPGMKPYLEAENRGTTGDCSEYFLQCETDILGFITHHER